MIHALPSYIQFTYKSCSGFQRHSKEKPKLTANDMRFIVHSLFIILDLMSSMQFSNTVRRQTALAADTTGSLCVRWINIKAETLFSFLEAWNRV